MGGEKYNVNFTDEWGSQVTPTEEELNQFTDDQLNELLFTDQSGNISSYADIADPVKYVDEYGNPVDPNDVQAGKYEAIPQSENQSDKVIYKDQNGNVIPEDQVQAGMFEVVPELSFLDKAINSFAGRMNDLNEGLYGTARLGADAIGATGASKFFNDQADLANVNAKMYREDNMGQETALSNAAAMAPEALYTLGVSALSAPVGIAYGVLKQGSETLGRDYNENENLGVASKRAAVDSLADLPLNFLPGAKGTGLGGYVKNAATTFGTMTGLNALSAGYKDYSQKTDIEGKTDVSVFDSAKKGTEDALATAGETGILAAVLPIAARGMSRKLPNAALDSEVKAQEAGIDFNKLVQTEPDVPQGPAAAPQLPDVMKQALNGEVPPINVLPPQGPTALPTRRGMDGTDLSFLKSGIEDGAQPVGGLVDPAGNPLLAPPRPNAEAPQPQVDIQRTDIGQMMRQAESGTFPGRSVPEVLPDAQAKLDSFREEAAMRMTPEIDSPITTAIKDFGGIGGRRAARTTGGEYDDAPTMLELGNRYKDIYKGTQTADQMHRQLVDQGLMSPDSNVTDMWNQVRRESRSERLAKQEAGKTNSFLRDVVYPIREKREKVLRASDLVVGDEITVRGKSLKVVDYNEDGTLLIDGGNDYGIQRLGQDDVVFADSINKIDTSNLFDFENYNLPDPMVRRELMSESLKLQQTRTAIGEGAKIDISSNAADLVKTAKMSPEEAMAISNKANQYRLQLERKLSKTPSISEQAAVRTELDRLDYVALDPDLMGRLQEQEPSIEMFNTREALRKAGVLQSADDLDSRLELDRGRGILDNEKGALNFEPITEFFKKQYENVDRVKTNLMPWETIAKQLSKELPNVEYKSRPAGQDFFEGKVGGAELPVKLSTLVENIRKGVNRPTDLSRKFPDFKYAYDEIATPSMDKAFINFSDFKEYLVPASTLPDKTVLNKVLQKVMKDSLDAYNSGKPAQVTKDTLMKAGVPEDVAIAADGVLKANNLAWEKQRESYLIRAQDDATLDRRQKIREISRDKTKTEEVKQAEIEKVTQNSVKALELKQSRLNDFFTEAQVTNYLPAMREGDIVISAKNKTTGEEFFDLAKDNYEYKTKVKNLAERGFEEIQTNKKEIPISMYDNKLDPLTRLELSKMYEEVSLPDGSMGTVINSNNATAGKKFKGFKAHLIPRKGIEGYRTDLFEATVDYLEGAAGHAAKTEYAGKRALHLDELADKKKFQIAKEVQDYYKEIDSPSQGLWKPARVLASHYNLGFFDPSAGLVDALGGAMSTFPELMKYSKNATIDYSVAKKDSLKFKMDREGFAKKNPELAKDLDYFVRAGRLGDQVSGITKDEVTRNAGAKLGTETLGEKLSRISMLPKAIPDELNRIEAFIAFHRNAPKGVSAKKFAMEMTDKTQGIYGPRNRPKMFRGPVGVHMGQMKEYFHNQVVNQSLSLTELYGSVVNKYRAEMGKEPISKEQRKILNDEVKGNLKRAVAYPATTLALGGLRASPYVALVSTLYSLVTDEKNPMERFRLKAEDMFGSFGADMMIGGVFRAVPKSVGMEGFSVGGQINLAAGVPSGEKPPLEEMAQFALGPSTSLGMALPKMAKSYNVTKDPLYAFAQGAPRGIKTKLQAYYGMKDGELRDGSNNTSVQDVQPEELVGLALGIQPDRKINYYEGTDATYRNEEEKKNFKKNFKTTLVNLEEKGDQAGFDAELQKALKAGMTEDEIIRAIEDLDEHKMKMRNPKYRMFKGAQNQEAGLERLDTLEKFIGSNARDK